MTVVLIVQVATFLTLGAMFLLNGDVRPGVAQILLAVIQGLIYS